MSKVTGFQGSFSAGVIAPSMYGRVAMPQYQNGLKDALNYIIKPQGGAENRPGTQFIYKGEAGRLIPFVYNSEQSYHLLFTDHAMRLIKDGSWVFKPLAGTAYKWNVSGTSGYCYLTTSTDTDPGVVPATGEFYVNGIQTAFEITDKDSLGFNTLYYYTELPVSITPDATMTVTDADTISITTPDETGTVDSSAIYNSGGWTVRAYLEDSALSMTYNEHVGRTLIIISGGVEYQQTITNNTTTRLYYGDAASPLADVGSTYYVYATLPTAYEGRTYIEDTAQTFTADALIGKWVRFWLDDVQYDYQIAANTTDTIYYGSYGSTPAYPDDSSTAYVYTLSEGTPVWPVAPYEGDYAKCCIARFVSPFGVEELPLLKFSQVADVMYLTHTSHAQTTLTRTQHYEWTFATETYTGPAACPITASYTRAAYSAAVSLEREMRYKISTVTDNVETLPSDEVLCYVDSPWDSGANVRITWQAVSGVDQYRVYKSSRGYYGWVGTVDNDARETPIMFTGNSSATTIDITWPFETLPNTADADGNRQRGIDLIVEKLNSSTGAVISRLTYSDSPSGDQYKVTTNYTAAAGKGVITLGTAYSNAYKVRVSQAVWYVDDNVDPDVADSHRRANNPFESSNYPACSAIFQQRMVYGGLVNDITKLSASVTGKWDDFSISRPLKASDSFDISLASLKVDEIRHMVPVGGQLAIMTAGSEWMMRAGTNGDAVTALASRCDVQSYRGCSDVPPLVVGSTVIFNSRDGETVYDLGYFYASDRYESNDLTVMAHHLLEGKTIKEWAYQQRPNSVVWCVMSDGGLLSFTYLKEHEVWAWARHATDGMFESVSCIPGMGVNDEVCFLIRRTINGTDMYYVEKLCDRLPYGDIKQGVFLDASLSTILTADTNVLSDINHLEGCGVWVVENGNVINGEGIGTETGLKYPSTLGNNLTIAHNGQTGPVYEDTDANVLTITDTENPLTHFINTAGNNLTRSSNSMPHYIAATVGNNATVTLISGIRYSVAATGLAIGDVGKTIRFLNADGTTKATALVYGYTVSGGDGTISLSVERQTGAMPTGTVTGGLWGFLTEDVLDVGDHTFTSASTYFDSGSVGKYIVFINDSNEEYVRFRIVTYNSGTSVGADFYSGTFPWWSELTYGGYWDFSTETPVAEAGAKTLTPTTAYFDSGDIGKYVIVIDRFGTELVRYLIVSYYAASGAVTANIYSGYNQTSATGGKWDFSDATITWPNTITCASSFFAAGNVGDTINIIDDSGNIIATYEINAYIDVDEVQATLTGLARQTSATGGMWGLDGAPITPSNIVNGIIVTDGVITLPRTLSAGALVHVGLPIPTPTLELLPIEVQGAYGKKRRIPKVILRVEKTRGLFVGPDTDNMVEAKWETPDNYNDTLTLFTGDKEIMIPASWDLQTTLVIQQQDPLPQTIAAVMPEVDFGG